jgi:hypothetical protein
MTARQLIIDLLDAAANVKCTVHLSDRREPAAVEGFRAWCNARRVTFETVPGRSGRYRFLSVDTPSGGHLYVAQYLAQEPSSKETRP